MVYYLAHLILCFIRNANFNNYDTRQNMNLHLPFTRINVTCRTLRYMGAKVWNYFNNIVKLMYHYHVLGNT